MFVRCVALCACVLLTHLAAGEDWLWEQVHPKATEGPGGSYGQSVPASDEALGDEKAVIAGLTANGAYRSNLCFTNLGADPVTLQVVLWETTGVRRGATSLELPPHGWLQSGTMVRELAGGPVDGAWVEVRSLTPEGCSQAFGSLVDNATDDPSTVLPRVASPDPWLVAAVASGQGLAGAFWRSDLEVVNPCSEPASYHLELVVGERLTSSTFPLGPHTARRHRDTVATDFGRSGVGALRVVPESGRVAVSSRTATAWQGGSVGQLVPAVREASARWRGQALALPGLAQSADLTRGRRSTIGLVNLSSTDVPLLVELHRGDGLLLASLPATVPASSQRQLVGVLAPFAPVDNAYAVIRSPGPDPDVPLIAYASVIDNSSGDPVYI